MDIFENLLIHGDKVGVDKCTSDSDKISEALNNIRKEDKKKLADIIKEMGVSLGEFDKNYDFVKYGADGKSISGYNKPLGLGMILSIHDPDLINIQSTYINKYKTKCALE